MDLPRLLAEQLRLASECCGAPGALWVGFSGGLDSTVLLHALTQLPAAANGSLRAIHVHHGLQSEGDAWQAFCQRFCADRGVPLTVRRVDLSAARGHSLEALARDARYRVFAESLATGDWLLTAHHLDDQAETFWLAALRGSGLEGLAGMSSIRPLARGHQLRPLLDVGRDELRRFARRQGLSWVEDPSNRDDRFDRNFLRGRVLPQVAERWPGHALAVGHSACLLRSAADILREWAKRELSGMASHPSASLPLAVLRGQPPDRAALLLYYWLRDQGFCRLPRRLFEQGMSDLLQARADGQPLLRWHEGELRRYRDRLYAMAPLPFVRQRLLPWPADERLGLPQGLGELRLVADPGVARERLRISLGGAGWRCRCAPGTGRKRIKHLYQELGVPAWLRGLVPVVLVDGEMLALADLFYCRGALASGLGGWLRWEQAPAWRSWLPAAASADRCGRAADA